MSSLFSWCLPDVTGILRNGLQWYSHPCAIPCLWPWPCTNDCLSGKRIGQKRWDVAMEIRLQTGYSFCLACSPPLVEITHVSYPVTRHSAHMAQNKGSLRPTANTAWKPSVQQLRRNSVLPATQSLCRLLKGQAVRWPQAQSVPWFRTGERPRVRGPG